MRGNGEIEGHATSLEGDEEHARVGVVVEALDGYVLRLYVHSSIQLHTLESRQPQPPFDLFMKLVCALRFLFFYFFFSFFTHQIKKVHKLGEDQTLRVWILYASSCQLLHQSLYFAAASPAVEVYSLQDVFTTPVTKHQYSFSLFSYLSLLFRTYPFLGTNASWLRLIVRGLMHEGQSFAGVFLLLSPKSTSELLHITLGKILPTSPPLLSAYPFTSPLMSPLTSPLPSHLYHLLHTFPRTE